MKCGMWATISDIFLQPLNNPGYQSMTSLRWRKIPNRSGSPLPFIEQIPENFFFKFF